MTTPRLAGMTPMEQERWADLAVRLAHAALHRQREEAIRQEMIDAYKDAIRARAWRVERAEEGAA